MARRLTRRPRVVRGRELTAMGLIRRMPAFVLALTIVASVILTIVLVATIGEWILFAFVVGMVVGGVVAFAVPKGKRTPWMRWVVEQWSQE